MDNSRASHEAAGASSPKASILRAFADLAERCEKATGPERGLDWACHAAKIGNPRPPRDELDRAPAYTASLDAAMTLVPDGMIVAYTNCDTKFSQPDFTKSSAIVGHADDPNDPSVAATPALALCAAALRAIAKARGEQ